MMPTIADPEVRALAALAATLQPEYVTDDNPWAGSPFAWIKTQGSSRRRGKIGEQPVAGFLASRDFDVARSPDSDADRLVNGHRVEIKFSTLWESGGYKLQQVREQNYALAICLGISPFDTHCWVLSKAVLRAHVIGKLGQHGGHGGQDTAWISVTPSKVPDWMAPTGGTLRAALAVLRKLAPRGWPNVGSSFYAQHPQRYRADGVVCAES